jgi:hypothetical protein
MAVLAATWNAVALKCFNNARCLTVASQVSCERLVFAAEIKVERYN